MQVGSGAGEGVRVGGAVGVAVGTGVGVRVAVEVAVGAGVDVRVAVGGTGWAVQAVISSTTNMSIAWRAMSNLRVGISLPGLLTAFVRSCDTRWG